MQAGCSVQLVCLTGRLGFSGIVTHTQKPSLPFPTAAFPGELSKDCVHLRVAALASKLEQAVILCDSPLPQISPLYTICKQMKELIY